tara:strand:- start:301 stop:528 length:228 start_codon:yes stop_codon:yes gene_type:complete
MTKDNLESIVSVRKPTREKSKTFVINMLDKYRKGEVEPKVVEGYFSVLSKWGYRFQKYRDQFYEIRRDNNYNLAH